jgi:protein subunit release factor B
VSEKRLLPKWWPVSLMLWGNHKNNRQVKMNFGVTRKKQEELEARMSALGLREADIKEKYVRSSGPGGQKVNKTASCVYLKHVGSGLEVKMQRERSQGLNRYYARKRLCELIEQEKLGSKSPAALKAEKIRKQKQRRKRRSKGADRID